MCTLHVYVLLFAGILIIALAQFLLMVGPEYARFVGIRALEPVGIFLPGENIDYPGGTRHIYIYTCVLMREREYIYTG